jgi:hypothetical protein
MGLPAGVVVTIQISPDRLMTKKGTIATINYAHCRGIAGRLAMPVVQNNSEFCHRSGCFCVTWVAARFHRPKIDAQYRYKNSANVVH